MLSGVTPSPEDELDRLRQRYERLCDLMTRTAEADPDAAERLLVELQAVSEQILALESGGQPGRTDAPASARGDMPGAPPGDATGADDVVPDAAPGSAPQTVSEAAPPAPPAGAPDRTERPPAAGRIPAPAPAPTATRVVAFRAGGTAARPSPAIAAPPPGPADAPAASPAAEAPGGPDAAAAPAPSATVFSSAIRQWLERHRGGNGATDAGLVATADAVPGHPPATASAAASPAAASPAASAPVAGPPELARIAASVEQQALQIERILALCQSQQEALERLEARIEARLAAPPADPAPMASAADPDLPELRHAIEEQRQRITALAKTIHNLAQWLATQRPKAGS